MVGNCSISAAVPCTSMPLLSVDNAWVPSDTLSDFKFKLLCSRDIRVDPEPDAAKVTRALRLTLPPLAVLGFKLMVASGAAAAPEVVLLVRVGLGAVTDSGVESGTGCSTVRVDPGPVQRDTTAAEP